MLADFVPTTKLAKATAVWTTVIAVVILNAACSSDPKPAPVDNKTTTLCASACKSAATCFGIAISALPPLSDLAGCQRQCALEVTGQGYLAKDIALLTMQNLAAAEATGGDVDCKLALGDKQFNGDNYLKLIADPAWLNACVEAGVSKCGTDKQIRSVWQSSCFQNQYYFNVKTRAEFEKCWALPDCDTYGRCTSLARDSRPQCSPWFGPNGAKCQ